MHSHIFFILLCKPRACLKKAFRELRVPVCGRFYPNEGGVAGYGNRMRVKYTAKWGLQIAEMIFQTRSRIYTMITAEINHIPYFSIIHPAAYCSMPLLLPLLLHILPMPVSRQTFLLQFHRKPDSFAIRFRIRPCDFVAFRFRSESSDTSDRAPCSFPRESRKQTLPV